MKIIEFYTEPVGDGYEDWYEMYIDGKLWNNSETMETNKAEMRMLSYGFDIAIWLEETDEHIKDNDYYCNVYINNECKLARVNKEKANAYIREFKKQKMKDVEYDKDLLWNLLKKHFGHKVEIAIYGDIDNPANISLEDMDTYEVILDAELYTIVPREEI